MKAIKTIKIFAISFLGSLILFPVSSMAQDEYDDMYFTPKDRKEIKTESVYTAQNDKAKIEADKKDVINPSVSTQVYGDAEENYSAKNVNPEYIERYKTNSKDSESAEDDAYYVENYDRSKFSESDSGNKSLSQYGYAGSKYGYNSPYYTGYNYYGRSFYDPFWNPYYGSGWGFSPGLSLSLSFGTGWGYSPWYSPYYGFGYSPWYSRYYYNPMAYNPWYYDPWYGPSYYGFGAGYAFYPGYYSNNFYYYGGNEYRQSSPYNRRISRGSDNYLVNDGSVPNRRTATISDQKTSDTQNINNRARTSRDYSRTQNEYYTRTQSGANYTSRAGNSSSLSTGRSRNSIGTTSTPRVRSSRSDIDYSRPSYRSATQSRSNANSYNYNSNRSTNRSSSWSGNTYQRSRSGNSYSSPSRSSGSYSGSSFNSGSSRSSYSGGSSAPSRSSGSSGSSSRSGGRR